MKEGRKEGTYSNKACAFSGRSFSTYKMGFMALKERRKEGRKSRREGSPGRKGATKGRKERSQGRR